jgi:hypothetical protein
MKMGTIASPWRYDGGAYHTLDREKIATVGDIVLCLMGGSLPI